MTMKTTMFALTMFAILGVAPLLGACHTTAGAGEDISKTGQAIENTADKAAPR
jgi:predicted small secreted protein